jgi:hypothetical protein
MQDINNTMAIRKNNIVTNNIQIVLGNYNNLTVIPVGTELKVNKTTRTGILYCTTVDRNITYANINVKATDVTLVDQPMPSVDVGEIFVCSWGYGQTNVDYYKVIEVLNKSVVIAPIGQIRNYTGSMQGECLPDSTKVGTTRKTKRINSYNTKNGNKVFLKINSFSTAFKWNGNTNIFTEWN